MTKNAQIKPSGNFFLKKNINVFKILDEMAAKIIGKSASDMAKIKEHDGDDERNFLKILNSSKYRQFNFSIKTALESWNEESRLRINVMNLEVVNYQDPKHIQRLKAEIEALQI